MKTLYLIRHAKSSWEDLNMSDINRPLNPRGLRDAPFMAKMLVAKEGKVDLIVSSPANRAFTTATYFAKEMAIPEEAILVQRKIYEAYPEEVLSVIKNLDNQHGSALIFGHNPTFTSLANRFSTDYISNQPTCGIVKLEANIDQWADFDGAQTQRTAFYFPKQYFS